MTSVNSALSRSPAIRRWPVLLSWGAIVGQTIFTLGWMISDSLQTGGFSPARDDISDLGALTARHPWIILAAQGISSSLTIAFALFALGPSLAKPGRRWALGAILLAASAVALDDLSDTFFRLDCQAANKGCTMAVATASWHGEIHAVVGTVTFVVLIIAPFVLARAMRQRDEWARYSKPAIGYGVGLLALLGVYLGLTGQLGDGTAQRVISLVASAGVALLAVHVARVHRRASHARADTGFASESSSSDGSWNAPARGRASEA
jgi:hypothetical membrane protein